MKEKTHSLYKLQFKFYKKGRLNFFPIKFGLSGQGLDLHLTSYLPAQIGACYTLVSCRCTTHLFVRFQFGFWIEQYSFSNVFTELTMPLHWDHASRPPPTC